MIWQSLRRFLSGAGNREPGIQYGDPLTRNYKAATNVTLDTAMQLSAVWACARLITECVGSLPIKIYEKKSDGSRVVTKEHSLAVLFSGKVNRWQTRQEYMESIVYQTALLGNDYSAVQRNSKNEIISLTPLMSEQMEVTLQDNGSVLYTYTDGANVNVYSDKTIWHNKLFGNGIIGLSPLSFAKNSVGIGLAAEESNSKVFQNGGKPSGVLTIDKLLTKDQRTAIKSSFAGLQEGNEDRLFVLEAGMKYQQVSLSPQDIQLLSARRFQIEDIARFFGVPSILINDTAASTTWGSGIHQIVQGFYKLGLRPYLERYEASMNARLLSAEERQRFEVEFDFDALLQPEFAERVKTGKEAVQGGLLKPNEWREGEGLSPAQGGDKLLVQRQMVPIERAGEDNGGTNGQNQNAL